MNSAMNGIYIVGENVYNFEFYTKLSVADKLRFVNSVSDILVDEKNYNYIVRDLLFDFFVIDVFCIDEDTREKVYELKHSNSFVNDVEHFLNSSNIVSVIKENVEYGLIDELNNALDLNIQYRTGIRPNVLSESIAKLINTIEKKIDGIDTDSMMSVANLLYNAKDEFTTENIVNAYISSGINKK